MIFTELEGSDLGVYYDENYQLVQCFGGHIVFSYSQKGNAMTAHFAADEIGLTNVRPAINQFCQWLFDKYDCEMIFAAIKNSKGSVTRLVKKCGFDYLAQDEQHKIYVRIR